MKHDPASEHVSPEMRCFLTAQEMTCRPALKFQQCLDLSRQVWRFMGQGSNCTCFPLILPGSIYSSPRRLTQNAHDFTLKVYQSEEASRER